jgi:hypothetical protein
MVTFPAMFPLMPLHVMLLAAEAGPARATVPTVIGMDKAMITAEAMTSRRIFCPP